MTFENTHSVRREPDLYVNMQAKICDESIYRLYNSIGICLRYMTRYHAVSVRKLMIPQEGEHFLLFFIDEKKL